MSNNNYELQTEVMGIHKYEKQTADDSLWLAIPIFLNVNSEKKAEVNSCCRN